MAKLLDILREVPDSRGKHGRMYPLHALLALTIAAQMCGRTSLSGIARFATQRSWPEMQQLGFTRCIRPAFNTLSVVFSQIDVAALEQALATAARGFAPVDGFHHLALDGKVLRGSVSTEHPKGMHLVSLFSQQLRGVLGQMPIDEGNEITAAIALLSQMDLADIVVTGDSMFTQREICRIIRDKGGHYVFALKGNQPSLHKAAQRDFSPA
jgi:hypothetical protein